MIDVIIADDHRVVAEGIARLIEESKVARVVAIAGTIGDTLSLLHQRTTDILLLDVAMPDGDGIDAIRTFHELRPDMRIIVLTCYAESAVIRRAVENGANGYLLKNVSSEEVINCIRSVAQGEAYICREAQVLTMMSSAEEKPSLTLREREILRLIVEGHTMKEIADKLCLGFETVHSYTKYLRQKLGCKNTASLVRTAIERRLV